MSTEAMLALLRDATLLFTLGVVGAAALRPPLLRGLGAGAAYFGWLIVPLVMASAALPSMAPDALTAALPAAVPAVVETLAAAAVPPAAAAGRGDAAMSPLPALMVSLWSLGVVALSAAMARRQHRYARDLERDGALWRAPAGASPALLGLLPPRLVLPLDFERRFDADECRLILAHEAVHARRHDNAWNLLGAALLALQWFNPLAWWAWRRMRADQELACDAAVLTTGAGRGLPLARYAQALLKSHRGAAAPVLATGWSARHPLVERVRLLGRHRRSALGRRAAPIVVLCLCTGAALLAQAARLSVGGPPDQSLVLTIEVSAQLGRMDWRRHATDLELPGFFARPGYHSTTVKMPQEGWCLDLMVYRFPDGMLRPTATVLDERCAAPLDAPQIVNLDGSAASFVARTPGGPLQAQLAVRELDRRDPRRRALLRPPSTPDQSIRLQDAQQEARNGPGEQRAIDMAWRAARASAR